MTPKASYNTTALAAMADGVEPEQNAVLSKVICSYDYRKPNYADAPLYMQRAV